MIMILLLSNPSLKLTTCLSNSFLNFSFFNYKIMKENIRNFFLLLLVLALPRLHFLLNHQSLVSLYRPIQKQKTFVLFHSIFFFFKIPEIFSIVSPTKSSLFSLAVLINLGKYPFCLAEYIK